MEDVYQKRYLAHQKRKKNELSGKYKKEKFYNPQEQEILKKIFIDKRSSRVYNGNKITDKELKYIEDLVANTPSSCSRKAINYKIITDREDKEILSGLLVGGVGWVNRADKIILLFADMKAYKNPNEINFMPYLDAGVKIMAFYLASEVLGIKCCYVNPYVREQNRDFFDNKFNYGLYCGALALGK